MKNYTCVMVLIMLFTGCSEENKDLPYELATYNGDLKVEQFDSTITDENRYNYNNVIFPVGSSFTYSYQYYTPSGERLNFRFTEDDWEFVDPDPGTVNTVELNVRSGLKPFIDWMPDYNQTIFTYQLSNKESYSMTGLIENEANLWMHPPREGLFKILELNPFPSVVYPLDTGREWAWSLRIGNGYADERWAVWDSVMTSNMTYEITGRDSSDTDWGKLETWTINADAVTEVGETSMEAVFNDSLGFLGIRYSNIDGSTIEFKLEEADI